MNEEPLDFSWATYKDPDKVDYFEKILEVNDANSNQVLTKNYERKEPDESSITIKTSNYSIKTKKKSLIVGLSIAASCLIVMNIIAVNKKKLSASNNKTQRNKIETSADIEKSENYVKDSNDEKSISSNGKTNSNIIGENRLYNDEIDYIKSQSNREDHSNIEHSKSFSDLCINVPEKAANYLTEDVYDMVINNFGEYIKKDSSIYGVDPNVVAGLIMVESPDYDINNDYDYHKIGLGQYKGEYFDNDTFITYNFETNEMESYTVHAENLYANPEEQIKMICITLATSAKDYDYNLVAMLEHHNKGCGSVNTSLNKIMEEKGYSSRDEVLLYEDQNEIIKNMPEIGDPRYSYKIAFCANVCIERHAFGDEENIVFKDYENNVDHIINLSINRYQRS